MKLLKGKKIADKILENLRQKIKKEKLEPGLAVFLVGDDKASEIYVSLKKRAAQQMGIKFLLFRYGENAKESKIISKIKKLNSDKSVSGIIVQLPLPKKFNTQKIINSINPEKDADGFSAKGGSAFGGHPQESSSGLQPVFPSAILKLLGSSGENLNNKKTIILANSVRFGEVMETALMNKGIRADYILAKNIKSNQRKIKSADIVISAVGKSGTITGNMIKKDAVIIDGGITKVGKKVLGDADFESVKKIAGYLTPVPGGVGPVTIACLLENVYLAEKGQSKL